MRVLFVHPSALLYSEIYLKLEPLGVQLVAAAAHEAGHQVRLVDLQVLTHKDYFRELAEFQPQAIGFSLNYLANIPEVLDLAKATKALIPTCFIFAGGHSVSFVAEEFLEHADDAISCVVCGEGEAVVGQLLDSVEARCTDAELISIPGVLTRAGRGPKPHVLPTLDRYMPARWLTRRRRAYFIGELDPCASIEFSRGCPWDCAFCSAWTFYGRTHRKVSTERAAEELAAIREPNVFIVDDVAFIHPADGDAIASAIERHKIRKRYYLETRADVLLRNREVFARWARLGLKYMFLGLEALDADGLLRHRKRIHPSKNFEALDVARELGITVAVNIIADPSWGEEQFVYVREWALSVPEIVHLTVQTPYPGTEIWHTESRQLTTLDYRLFDVQHAVLPTKLGLRRFYQELVQTQNVLNRKHLGFAALRAASWISMKLLLRGRTNFLRMIWKFNQVYNDERQYADHLRPVKYAMRAPIHHDSGAMGRDLLFVHTPAQSRAKTSVAQVG